MFTSANIGNWIQAATGIAVVIGVVLVLVELEQSRKIAEAELLAEQFSTFQNILGEDPMDSVAKACEAPESLTHRDALILDEYFKRQWNMFRYMRTTNETAGFDTDWKLYAESRFSIIFRTQAGRNWYQSIRGLLEPEVAQLANGFLDGLGEPNCDQLLKVMIGK